MGVVQYSFSKKWVNRRTFAHRSASFRAPHFVGVAGILNYSNNNDLSVVRSAGPLSNKGYRQVVIDSMVVLCENKPEKLQQAQIHLRTKNPPAWQKTGQRTVPLQTCLHLLNRGCVEEAHVQLLRSDLIFLKSSKRQQVLIFACCSLDMASLKPFSCDCRTNAGLWHKGYRAVKMRTQISSWV